MRELRSRVQEPELDVEVQGLTLSDEERAALREEVSRIVAEARRLPTEQEVLGRQSAPTADAAGGLAVRLAMNLAPEAERRIEEATRSLLGKHLRPERSATLVVCEKSLVPGTMQDLDPLENMPWPPPAKSTIPYPGTTNKNYLIVGFWFMGASGKTGEDVARLIVEDGRFYWGQDDPNRMDIGLATQAIEGGSFGVDWEKSIRTYYGCGAVYQPQEIRSGHRTKQPVFMQVRPDLARTVILSKPKGFGTWTDMYNLAQDDFWRLFGGKRATFIWGKD